MSMSQEYGNLSDIELIPIPLRKHYLDLLETFDTEWKPLFTRFMPKVVGDGEGSKKEQSLGYDADPQLMAKFHDPRERVQVMNAPHMLFETVRARTLKMAFREDLEEFEGDFQKNVIARKHASLLRSLTRSINRSVEWTLTNYVFGNAATLAVFGNQNPDRQARANMAAGTFNGAASAHLSGRRWDQAYVAGTPTIFNELNYLKDRFELMAGEEPEFLVIGRVTTRSLEDDANLLNRLIQIKDTTQGVLGAAIQGLKIIRVVGQTYKEAPGVDVTQEGFPGGGDYLRQSWARLNKIDMMTQLLGGNRVEWGMITNRHLGETRCAWVHKPHAEQRANPTQMYIKQWQNEDPLENKTRAAFCFTPLIKDWAQSLIIERTAIQD